MAQFVYWYKILFQLCSVFQKTDSGCCTTSEKSWIGVLDDTLPAKLLDSPVAFDSNQAILYVELSEATAIVSDRANTFISHKFTAFNTEFLQIRTVLCQHPQSTVTDVTFSQIQCSESGTAPSQHFKRIVADRFTSSQVQVSQFVTMAANLLDAGVGNLITFSYW